MRKKILLLTLTLSAVMLAAGCGKPKTVKEDIVAESDEKDAVDITTDPQLKRKTTSRKKISKTQNMLQ